jgi:hypothetical protein
VCVCVCVCVIDVHARELRMIVVVVSMIARLEYLASTLLTSVSTSGDGTLIYCAT